MIDISNCKSINDIARLLYEAEPNYNRREKAKKYLAENGIDWEQWLKEKKEESTLHCLNCGKVLEIGQKKFCCSSCSATYNNKLRGKRSPETKEKISESVQKYYHPDEINKRDFSKVYHCINCGKEIKYKKTCTNKYCSQQCKNEYEYNCYIERWHNGEESGLSGKSDISRYIRRYLFEKYNGCQVCGWNKKNEYTNRIPLQIHHINGDCTNNKEENLQLLCPNCHTLTENFGSRNKNCTRIDLRKRY